MGACHELAGLLVSADEERPVPMAFSMEQNYPHPFYPVTVVMYQLPEAGHLRLVVYDMPGWEVAVLADEVRVPGIYAARFDGSGCASGVSFLPHAGPLFGSRRRRDGELRGNESDDASALRRVPLFGSAGECDLMDRLLAGTMLNERKPIQSGA